jgi:hypothetical protein
LKALLEPETGGDPMSGRKWRRSSLRHLSRQLDQSLSHTTVGRLLRQMNYGLKANVKRLAGQRHPDRETQFIYLEQQKQAFLQARLPVISVDTKKKELIGQFKNPGRHWCKTAEAVNEHDFDEQALGKAVPYGIYDLAQRHGYVYVGRSADTPEFAVEMMATWWRGCGQFNYPAAQQLLVLADAGGSNAYRSLVFKQQLQDHLADEFGLAVTLCHYPTGASKWNPIEHRLFGPISQNWAGHPLRTFETMLAFIRGTVNAAGLQVEAFLIDKLFKIGLKVTKAVINSLQLDRHAVCPKWNYTIRPRHRTQLVTSS